MKKATHGRGKFQTSARQYVFNLTLIALFSLSVVLLPIAKASAATPAAGTINTNGPNLTWTGDKIGGAAPNAEADCVATVPGVPSTVCDQFTITVGGTPTDWTDKRVRVQINWVAAAYDYDMYIHKTSATGNTVGTSANGTTTFEQADISPASTGTGVYVVQIVYFAAATPLGASDPNQYKGIASVVSTAPPFQPPTSTCSTATFDAFQPPTTLPGYNDAGEPSLGINWNTGNVLFQAYFNMLRATFNDSTSPAVASWKSFNPINQPASLDPILFTDSVTGRTIPGQLLAAGGTSATAITDNDGDSFTPNITTGITSGVDHQTIGAGPYHANNLGIGPITNYPNAWYYASQDIAVATATRSDNGGLTYGPAVPMYNLLQCSGLHGHVKVAPDGTVYVPNKNCPDPDMNAATVDGGQGFSVSIDNGTTWTVRALPGSGSGDNDPAVGIGAGGRVFFGYTGSDKHMRAAVSDDQGRTWKFDQDIGLPFNVKAAVFPAATAGDNNRASIFFLGTDSSAAGDPTGDDAGVPFAGTWYPYIATTCDGGRSWSVVRAGDVVQQGVVCTSGTTCPSGTRNLLDFNDLQVDRYGRILAALADGCVTAACRATVNGTKTQNDKLQVATILRQRGGSRLFSDYDAGGPAAPTLPPPVEVTAAASSNRLEWQTPDSNGSPITNYKIYRGTGDSAPTLISEVAADVHTFRDAKTRAKNVYYQVTVSNAFGESPRTERFFPQSSKKEKGE